ncbi:MAG: hypoxanthine phosphoribosyltransferase [Sphingobacteriaceae bacterium]
MIVAVGDKFFEPLLSRETIEERVIALGAQLSADYGGKTPVFVGVLSGSFLFLADLVKSVTIPCETQFVKVASYAGDHSTGKISESLAFSEDLKGRHVIIVEDIVDSGHTLHYLLQRLASVKPQSVSVCSLLLKPGAVQYSFPELRYVGFELANDFVVGYGLDYNGLGRNLPEIYKVVAN